jgi:hypothetical protein
MEAFSGNVNAWTIVATPEDLETAVQFLQYHLPHTPVVQLTTDRSNCTIQLKWARHDEKDARESAIFEFRKEQWIDRPYSLVLRAVAQSAKNLKVLEARAGGDLLSTAEDLSRLLTEFENAGYWGDSLETLCLKYWNLGHAASGLVSHLQSLPCKLKHLAFHSPSMWAEAVAIPLTDDVLQSVYSSLSKLESLESVTVHCSSLSTEFCDQILHVMLFHTQIRKLTLHHHIPGPPGIGSLISYLSLSDISLHSLRITVDAEDERALERVMAARLGAFALEDATPEAATPAGRLQYIRRNPRPSKTNEYLRWYHVKKLWDCNETGESVRPVLLAKVTGPSHRSKLFTLLHRQTNIFWPKDELVDELPSI